jgi:hypothetical protein
MGYHLTKFKKGVVGEISKIQEELDELKDAAGRNKILELCELSDICAAIQRYLEKHHPTITMEDLIGMGRLTISSFNDGERRESKILD